MQEISEDDDVDYNIQEKKDCPAAKSVILDPSTVSRFEPSEHNVFHCSGKTNVPEMCLIGMKHGETINFQGYLLVALISGDAIIMGHRLQGVSTLQDGKELAEEITFINYNDDLIFHPIYSPKTHSLISIESVERRENLPIFSNRGIKASLNIKQTINDLLIKSKIVKENFDTILVFREMTWCGIQGIEKIASSCFKNIFTAENVNSCRNNQSDETDSIKRNLFQISGFYPILEVIAGLTSLQLSDSWLNAANQLAIDVINYNVPPIVVICGHRNVGKSTFARYLLNNLLNVYDVNCPKVAYIESDVGQSEFTPPGSVSLNILDSPIFGPPFTHIQRPYRSYYVGNNTPRDDPDYYLDCLRELVIVYRRDIACGPDFGMHADDEIQRIPLILNTHGWIKGMGYDLLLSILGFAKPTHLFQFHSLIHSYQNLPPFPVSILSPPNEDPPKVFSVEAIDNSKISTKYTAVDYRTLAMLSYFYSTPAILLKQENAKWWQFDKPLIHHSPWCLDWTKGLMKGVFVFFNDVPWSQLLYALNGSIVGLVGNISDIDESHEMIDETEPSSGLSQEKEIYIQPPRYFPCPDYPPPTPSEYSFLGHAIIRSIDPATHTFHILTPLSYVELQKTSFIVKGSLELPIWFMMDHTNNISTGVCGVPWKRVPYMNFEVREGVGNSAQR
ncbi:9641_t:CDS:2, partial [Scutellospora calospora]